jgi:hypothetical protein
VQLVTLRYCSLQTDRTGIVCVTLYWGVFVLTLVDLNGFGKLLDGYGKTNSLWNMFEPLVVRGSIPLTVNNVLHEVVTEFSAVVRTH